MYDIRTQDSDGQSVELRLIKLRKYHNYTTQKSGIPGIFPRALVGFDRRRKQDQSDETGSSIGSFMMELRQSYRWL